ncbi:hypothetical protein BGX31_010728 [Mortierella sp. GBA43]|nr:hypothetical protein BGX31_010728 [Mortierella sp. GBA43]
MDIAHLGTLTDVVSLRDPARRNHFTILAKARLGSRQVLLHQSRAKQSWSPVQDVDVWFKVLSEDPDSSSESCLLRVLGVLPTPLPKSIAVNSVPGSISSAHGLDRPVYVVDYHERGSLRSCLDKGEFSHSNWPAKLTVLKDIAKALHYIRCHMPGQQHGALSSDTVYIDKDGHAFLSWHSCGRTRQDFESGKCRDWRWFSPNTLLQLQDTLDQDNDDPMEVIDLELDDMYSFGVLAWETVTDELPFEKLQLFSRQRPAQNIDKRFLKRPPRPVMEIIERCLDTDKDNRPSWCSILSQLDALVPEALDAEYDEIDNDVNPPLVVDLAQPLPSPTSLDDNKSKVVEMMESILGSTFYKKELPVHLDSFTGVAGRKLFREMIQAGTGECFFSLFTSFSTQNDPAFCGVSSLSMVLNALEIDPRRQWKGVWRWYTDEQLDCCASISEMRLKGITFNQFSCLARCHASVVSKPADRHSLEEFRRDIQLITSSEGTHMVISFSRPALGQTGSGHFR